MRDDKKTEPPKPMWALYFSEFVGTGLLLTLGLSFVIFNWGEGSVTARLLPNESLRRAVTGFLFGSTGCLISIFFLPLQVFFAAEPLQGVITCNRRVSICNEIERRLLH